VTGGSQLRFKVEYHPEHGYSICLSNDDNQEPPQYDFTVPDDQIEAFDYIGLCELLEGVFTFPEEIPVEEIKQYLTNLGYKEF
jgi:hypothetical protein